MKRSTREKLFMKDERVRTTAEFSDEYNNQMTQIIVNGFCIVITEFANEADGFDAYIRIPGNDINAVRKELGLPPRG